MCAILFPDLFEIPFSVDPAAVGCVSVAMMIVSGRSDFFSCFDMGEI